MATISGAAIFKKKSGMLTIHEDKFPSILMWKAIDSSVPVSQVELVLNTITNLQATPASSDKMMLKIISKNIANDENVNTVFSFNNRPTMNNIKETLQQIIARQKTTIQAAATASKVTKPLINSNFLQLELNSDKLLKNHQLQQKLLVENKELMANFKESVMNSGLDPEEFWSTRIHLLRAFALSNSQKRGPYHVLSSIKPVASSDNQVNVSVTREKIQVIFEQYPIVRRAYDENVPKLSEGEFWSRFFSSKLFRRLRGEKLNQSDRGDMILDKYLYIDQEAVEKEQSEEDHSGNSNINKFIDIEGNEEDNSQKLGNAPDMTMRSGKNQDMITIMRNMNKLSEKMVSKTDTDEVLDETDKEKAKEDELYFSDLEEKESSTYIELNVNKHITTTNKNTGLKGIGGDGEFKKFMVGMKDYFHEPVDLTTVYNNESKKRSIEQASAEISKLIRLNSKQSKQSWNFNSEDVSAVVVDADPEIDVSTLEEIRLTHSTSIEFLKHFWAHFNSGDPSQANSVKKLYLSVKKCKDRVDSAIDNIENGESKKKAREYMNQLILSLDNAINVFNQASSGGAKTTTST